MKSCPPDHRLLAHLDWLEWVSSGFRKGALFGLYVRRWATLPTNIILVRVAPWPDMKVHVSVDRGRSWDYVSEPLATGVLGDISDPQNARIQLQVKKRIRVSERCPDRRARIARHYEHLLRFSAHIPVAIRARSGREADFLVLLRLYARCARAEDLYNHDPVLTRLLSVHWRFRSRAHPAWDALSALISGDRRRLLNFVGLPPLNGVRKVLQEIAGWLPDTQEEGVIALLGTKGFLEAAQRDMSICEWIPKVLERLRASPKTTEALRRTSYGPEIWLSDQFREVMQTAISIAEVFPAPELMLKLVKIRGLWSLDWELVRSAPSPPLPWPGNQQLVPLRTWSELVEEAREMENDLSTADKLRAWLDGWLAVYRITTPVRATLVIRLFRYGCRIEGPLGKGNTRLPEDVAEPIITQIEEVDYLRMTGFFETL